jgi:DNA processing protein
VRRLTDREAWLVLSSATGVGPRTAGALVRRLGSPAAVLVADPARLSACPGVGPLRAEALAAALRDADPAAIVASAERAGLSVLTPADAAYPPLLSTSPDAPPAIYVRGAFPPPDRPHVAIVGTRAATPYGLRVARTLAEDLSREGAVVVSGLARGVDGAAHAGCLKAGGATVAVLGCGADVVYPPEHHALAGEIAASGCVVSEHPPGTPPQPGHFPRRNRIVAALARATVVVEAGLASGALSTARIAGEIGRDVLAVPGPVDRGSHAGCHRLLKDGATLCETAGDVWRALGRDPTPAGAARPPPPGDRAPPPGPALTLWRALDADEALDPDALALRTGLSPDAVAEGLTTLELDVRAVRVPGVGFLKST